MKKILFLIVLASFYLSNTVFADDSLLKLAESGNPEAQYKVASMYASGKIGNKSEQDKKKMFELLEKSANQGYLKAQEILCSQYYDRCEFEKSWKWANIALKKGSNVAKSILAVFYFDGCGGIVPIDKSKAVALIRECPDEIESKSILCNLYIQGWFDIEPDAEKALSIVEDLEKRNYYQVELFKRSIKIVFNIKNNDDINECFEKAIKLNKYYYPNKSYYVEHLIDFVYFYPEFKEKIEEIINELIEVNYPDGYYCNYLYELKVKQNIKKSEKNLLKAAEMYCPNSYFDAYMVYLKQNGNENLKKAREIAEKALKCQDPDVLSEFIVFFNKIENSKILREVVGEAYIEGFNDIKNIKIAADNGDSKMMYLYSKLTSDKNESEKYLKGASNRRCDFASGELAYSLLKSNPEKAYKIIKFSSDIKNSKSPELLFVDGIIALEGKLCEKNVLYGLKQLEKSLKMGIKNKAEVIKTIYNGYCNIDENEYVRNNDVDTDEDAIIRKKMDIYEWGKKYMEFASEDEKEEFDNITGNYEAEIIQYSESRLKRKMERNNYLRRRMEEELEINNSEKSINLDVFDNPVFVSHLTTFGKVFEDSNIDSINYYVEYYLYKVLFDLYGKNEVSKEENNIPDECYDNLKKITSAVEMYNMDSRYNMTDLNINLLRKKGYIRNDLEVSDPECSYSIIYYSKGEFKINCSKHGHLE